MLRRSITSALVSVVHSSTKAALLVATQDRLVAELGTLRGLLAAIREAARPRTSWLGGWRWLLKAS
jgi:hypothetical protein